MHPLFSMRADKQRLKAAFVWAGRLQEVELQVQQSMTMLMKDVAQMHGHLETAVLVCSFAQQCWTLSTSASCLERTCMCCT